jgi:type IV secretion system protein VirB6
MGSDFVSDLMQRVNGIGERFVSATYGSLGGSLQTAFTAALTIYVAWWGIQLVTGRAGVSAADIVWRVGRACLVYALVFSWSSFELLVFNVADKIPTAIGKVILNGVTGSTSDPTQALSDVWHAAQKASSAWWRQRASATSVSTSWRR